MGGRIHVVSRLIKMKKTLVVLILCNIMLLLTAMTCNDSYEYRSVIFENQSNDTIITWSSGWKPTTPEAVIEYYSDEWATQIPPHEHSVESWVDEEARWQRHLREWGRS